MVLHECTFLQCCQSFPHIGVIFKNASLYLFFSQGLGGMLVGASLLDLEYVTQSDTATISLVVIGRSLGSVLGNITSGKNFVAELKTQKEFVTH